MHHPAIPILLLQEYGVFPFEVERYWHVVLSQLFQTLHLLLYCFHSHSLMVKEMVAFFLHNELTAVLEVAPFALEVNLEALMVGL